MSDTNVTTVDRMTQAIFDQDHDTLAQIFTDGFVFHFRAPLPNAGDYKGVGGLLEVLGGLFEATNGDIKLFNESPGQTHVVLDVSGYFE